MIKDNTVFILGAGASKPYKFPTSRELKNDIINNSYNYFLQTDDIQRDQWTSIQRNEIGNRFRTFTKQYLDSRITSIDLFLNANPDLEDIGKTAIILTLDHFEKEFVKELSTNVELFNWYDYLFNYLIDDIRTIDKIVKLKGKISFITFNYDRSLEYFLWNAFKNYFNNVDPVKITQTLSSLPVYHVYGMLGRFNPYLNDHNIFNAVGGIASLLEVHKLKDSIKTIYQRTQPEKNEFHDLIKNANAIYYMGFGFAEENIKAIGLNLPFGNRKKGYSTSVDLTKREQYRVLSRLSPDLKELFNFADNQTCLDLLRNSL